MRIICCPDAFKGTLAAGEAAEAIARGLRAASGGVETVCRPLADGGEGTLEVLGAAVDGEPVEVEVTGPRGEPVRASHLLLDGGRIALVEMARAAGLGLVEPGCRDPVRATTRGVGEIVRDGLERGVDEVVVGLGGSATCDGGLGLATALGVRLLDGAGRPLPAPGLAIPVTEAMERLARIDASGRHPGLERVRVVAACDVASPLVGPAGAADVYARQKGAGPADVRRLGEGLRRLARRWEEDLGADVVDRPGAGAAGGLGAGLAAFCGARLVRGIEWVAGRVGLDGAIEAADAVVTGEGCVDRQTMAGKTAWGVVRRARKAGKPAVVVAGRVGDGGRQVAEEGRVALVDASGGRGAPESEKEAGRRLEQVGEEVVEALRSMMEVVREPGCGSWCPGNE